nr:helix-turn-helix transcriptional regulator [Streptomyces poonensis]
MHRPPAQHETQPTLPALPFDPLAARRLRAGLGMEVEHVAYGMRSSYGLPYVAPDLVMAWERGDIAPTGPELTALAGMLWCSVGELLGTPRTLREHRLARGLTPAAVARGVGLDLPSYQRMEESGRWTGTRRQTSALAALLALSLPDLVTVTGREEKLAELLRTAVTTHWHAQVRPLAKLLPLDRRLLESVLEELHTTYRRQMAASLSWADGTASADAGTAGHAFLDHIVERFWSTVGTEEAGG